MGFFHKNKFCTDALTKNSFEKNHPVLNQGALYVAFPKASIGQNITGNNTKPNPEIPTFDLDSF